MAMTAPIFRAGILITNFATQASAGLFVHNFPLSLSEFNSICDVVSIGKLRQNRLETDCADPPVMSISRNFCAKSQRFLIRISIEQGLKSPKIAKNYRISFLVIAENNRNRPADEIRIPFPDSQIRDPCLHDDGVSLLSRRRHRQTWLWAGNANNGNFFADRFRTDNPATRHGAVAGTRLRFRSVKDDGA